MLVSFTTAWLLLISACDSGNICPVGCKYCTHGDCYKCFDGYYTKEDFVCRRCSANCQACLSGNNCTKCDSGYYLQTKDNDEQFCHQCTEGCSICSSQECFQCDIGYFQNNNTCRRCVIDCVICKSENECLQCKDGYHKIDDLCSVCPGESYYLESSCLPCPTNCAFCSRLDECTKCKPGFFGPQCTHTCSSGCIDNVCGQKNGQCPCKINFVGKTCDECKSGCFGDNCDRNCSKGCIGNICSRESGDCYKCKAYFKWPTCTECVDGKWGEDCRMDCPDNCLSCLSPTECTRCKDGYHGGACEKNCSDGCSLKLCEQTTGICSQNCTKMFMGQYCDQCIDGRYGKDDCSEECPKNCYNNVCDMIDGRCNEGCKPRFYGPNCDLPCPVSCKLCSSNTSCQDCDVGFWGGYCQNQCPKNCLNNTCLSDEKCTLCTPGYCHNSLNCCGHCPPLSCNDYSGVCQYGCKRGYWGKWCEIECPANCLPKNCHTDNGTCKDIYLERKIGNSSPATRPVGTVILLVSVAVLIIYAVVITTILVRKRCIYNRHVNTMSSRDEVGYTQGRKVTKIVEDVGHIYAIPEEDQTTNEGHTNPDSSSVYIHPIHVVSENTAEYESVC